MATYTPSVKEVLRAHGCHFERPGKGDHEGLADLSPEEACDLNRRPESERVLRAQMQYREEQYPRQGEALTYRLK